MFRIIVISLVSALVQGDPIRVLSIARPTLDPIYPQGRIVGGQETTIEQHPWQVSLQVLGFHFCGGSIISEDTILTAGHCTVSYPASMMSIRVGSSRTESGGALHGIREIIRHENYRTNIIGVPENDVAVLKLKTLIELDKSRQPISLFDMKEIASEGVLSTITGWGDLQEAGASPDVLHSVDVPIVTKTECNKAYESWGGIPEGQICAAFPAGGKDACQGDSGGPLIIGGRQAGIVSWGNGCARKGYPGVYTEIASFRDWINEHMGLEINI